MSLSQHYRQRFTADEIEEIIQQRLKNFNPVAVDSTAVNGSIGCACNTLVNDDLCPSQSPPVPLAPRIPEEEAAVA